MPKSDTQLTVYQKPTCTTCRNTLKLIEQGGRGYRTVNYYERPFTKRGLAALLRKAGLKPREALRTKEAMYKKLGLARKALGDDELIGLMVEHPDLIQRPFVEAGDKAILARPAERVKRLLR